MDERENHNEKKSGKAAAFFKAIFVHNAGLKWLAIGVAAVLVALAVIL